MSGVGGIRIGSGWARAVLIAALLGAPPVAAQTSYETARPLEPGPGVCPAGLCQPEALSPLFEALAATEAGTREEPVHILQLGDSHTAGDRITGKMRAVLQGRFGSAGRGAIPAGVPHPGYSPYQVQVTTDGWPTEVAALRGPNLGPSAAFGLGAVRAQATRDSVLTLTFESGAEPRFFGACGWARGEGHGLKVEGAGEPEHYNLNGHDEGSPVCLGYGLDQSSAQLRLTGEGAGVVLSTVWTETLTPGVMVSNLGLPGSTLRDLAGRDDTMLDMELGVWDLSLIILAYGVNEGFEDGLDPVAYEALLRDQIARMRQPAPFGPAILILGAPDAQRSGVTGGCSVDGQRAPPPSLALVRDVQRRVAADMGVAFWDWHGRMGGDCSADRLALRAEPYVRADRVHFTSAGADWIGGVLAADLMAAYDAWKAGRGGVD